MIPFVLAPKHNGRTETMSRDISSPASEFPRRDGSAGGAGFTLVELLVVVAIIAILAGLLLPALTRAKSQATSIGCLNNLKQLTACWHLYATDNQDVVPPNNFVYDIVSDRPLILGGSWCTNLAPFDSDTAGIQNGALFQYNQSLGIYHCPADKSTLQTRDGTKLPQPRLRSYNMSQSFNGYAAFNMTIYSNIPCFGRWTEVRSPDTTKCFVFLDVHEDEIMDTEFGIPTQADNLDTNSWWDVPANRHNQGCNFSFADGHAEHWRWSVPKAVTVPRGFIQPVGPGEQADYNRMETGFRQSLN